MDDKTKAKIGAGIIAGTMIGGSMPALAAPEQPGEIYSNENYVDSAEIDTQKVLENLYVEQMNTLVPALENLKKFYTDVDTKNIIKTAYSYAYDAFQKPLNDSILLDEQTNVTNAYISLIIRNNNILNSLRIKSAGNARDTDYGVIMDPNSEYGFRIKTEEDKNLIEQYSRIIENRPIISNDLLDLFIKAQSLTQSGPTR